MLIRHNLHGSELAQITSALSEDIAEGAVEIRNGENHDLACYFLTRVPVTPETIFSALKCITSRVPLELCAFCGELKTRCETSVFGYLCPKCVAEHNYAAEVTDHD